MGITERRYQNWDAALGHYLRAKELAGKGFCEPDYWIGVTRINRGVDIDIGVEVRPVVSRCPESSWYLPCLEHASAACMLV